MSLFKRGAWLYSLDKPLREDDFIYLAGGVEKLNDLRSYPFVSLVLDDMKNPILIGHRNGRVISIVMNAHGYKKFQTMEWKVWV